MFQICRKYLQSILVLLLLFTYVDLQPFSFSAFVQSVSNHFQDAVPNAMQGAVTFIIFILGNLCYFNLLLLCWVGMLFVILHIDRAHPFILKYGLRGFHFIWLMFIFYFVYYRHYQSHSYSFPLTHFILTANLKSLKISSQYKMRHSYS